MITVFVSSQVEVAVKTLRVDAMGIGEKVNNKQYNNLYLLRKVAFMIAL